MVLATHDRLAKLHGLDRPTQFDIVAPMTAVEVVEQARTRLLALTAAADGKAAS